MADVATVLEEKSSMERLFPFLHDSGLDVCSHMTCNWGQWPLASVQTPAPEGMTSGVQQTIWQVKMNKVNSNWPLAQILFLRDFWLWFKPSQLFGGMIYHWACTYSRKEWLWIKKKKMVTPPLWCCVCWHQDEVAWPLKKRQTTWHIINTRQDNVFKHWAADGGGAQSCWLQTQTHDKLHLVRTHWHYERSGFQWENWLPIL